MHARTHLPPISVLQGGNAGLPSEEDGEPPLLALHSQLVASLALADALNGRLRGRVSSEALHLEGRVRARAYSKPLGGCLWEGACSRGTGGLVQKGLFKGDRGAALCRGWGALVVVMELVCGCVRVGGDVKGPSRGWLAPSNAAWVKAVRNPGMGPRLKEV